MVEALVPAATVIVRLRAKNQLTLPDAIVRQLGVQPGDRFRAWVAPDGSILMRRSGASSYGKYSGMWGATPEEIEANLQGLRDEWER
jgi:bifunctional DNA-binding transcriptional regulator/antitoxin component of YhaV-PrlF toxin-antitoxin module